MAFDKWPFDLGGGGGGGSLYFTILQNAGCTQWHGEVSFTKMDLIYRQEV